MEKKDKLPLWKILAYGSGDLGFSMNNSIITAFFSVFMVTVVGMPPGLVAIIFIIGRSWDFVNDPIIGHLSDRTRTRWGRRRPFLLFGAIPFGLSFTLLWLGPNFDQTGLIIYYSLAYIALKLKEAFGLDDINDLPISYDIAWYEQKAVIVLLALLSLGIKGIRLGPSLPAFLSENVTKVLVEKFNIKPISSVQDDVQNMMLGN